MTLFSLVTDALEDSAEDDSAWLEAARSAADLADETGRIELGHTLRVIDQGYHLGRVERVALREVEGTELRECRSDPDELASLIMSVLAVCRDYRAAFESVK